MATIPIATILQWCGMITASSRNRITADIMILQEGMKHLNGEKSEEMIGTFRYYDRMHQIEISYSPEFNKGGWYPSWIWWRIGTILRKMYHFQMERQYRNSYKNLSNPQLRRSTGKTKIKLGNIWSQLASKYISNLPGDGIVGWWSLRAT